MEEKYFNENKYICLLKAMAIFSVVCAHSAGDMINVENMSKVVSELLSFLGVFGVPLFYVISGYLFKKDKKVIKEFWKGKFNNIVIPWVFCETIVWLYVVLRKGGISPLSWIKFIVGINHSTYYLTILLVFYLIFWKIRNKKGIIVTLGILSIISIFASSTSEYLKVTNSILITPYLNPFNWLIYFAIGMLVNEFGLNKLGNSCKKILYITLPFSIVLLLFYLKTDWNLSYFSRAAFLVICVVESTILGMVYIVKDYQTKFLRKLGEYSFSIYLLHELIVGIVIYVTNRMGNAVLIVLRPFVVILVLMIGIELLKKVVSNSQFIKVKIYKLTGIRS